VPLRNAYTPGVDGLRLETVERDDARGDLLRRMPKAELHLHLDGSLRPATAFELARARGLAGGMTPDAMAARLAAPDRCRDQAELLATFDLPVAILQDAESLRRAAGELVEDVAGDGTRYAEIRWAPGLHVRGGLTLRDGIAAVVAGVRDGIARVAHAASARGSAAGSPDGAPPVTVRLIAVAMRSHDPGDNVRVAETAAGFLGEGVTGFDLAGLEGAYPDPMAHVQAFAAARAAGLGITVHAGEWGGPAQVRRALALEPARIAHGSPAADDPSLVDELRVRGVTLDLCPTSNAQAGIVDGLERHPLPRLARAGVPVTLSTDDRTVSRLTLVEEYRRAVERLGITLPELWAMDRHALEVAFLQDDEATRRALLGAFGAFAAVEPAVGGRADEAG
jgi:adenosine deaminase